MGHSAVGDPLYTTSPTSQTITSGSYVSTVDGSCQPGGGYPTTANAVVPTGTTITIGNFTGPLTLTK